MFAEISKKELENKPKNSEAEFEEKMNNKGDGIFKTISTIDEIKETTYNNELNKSKCNIENEIEIRRRLKHKSIPVGYGNSLFDNLQIDKGIFEKSKELNVTDKDIDILVAQLGTSNINDQYVGLVGIRKLLTSAYNAPVQEIIDRGVVFILINLLEHQLPEFVYEATICLTTICSGTSDQSNTVVMKGGAVRFIQLCDAKFFEIQEQAILGIGNLASDGYHLRDTLIELGALDKILFYLKTSEVRSLISNCLFCLTNFTRGTSAPPYEKLAPFLDHAVNFMIKFSNDQEIVTDCIWIIGYMAENYKKVLKSIYDFKMLRSFVKLLE